MKKVAIACIVCLSCLFCFGCGGNKDVDPAELVGRMREILKNDKLDLDALQLNNAGYALYNQKNYEEAIVFFRASLKLKPDYEFANYNLACSLSLMHGQGKKVDTDEIMRRLSRSLDLDPKKLQHMKSDPDLGPMMEFKEFRDFVGMESMQSSIWIKKYFDKAIHYSTRYMYVPSTMMAHEDSQATAVFIINDDYSIKVISGNSMSQAGSYDFSEGRMELSGTMVTIRFMYKKAPFPEHKVYFANELAWRQNTRLTNAD